MSNGKGSKPRNCFSKNFKDNYDTINWKRNTIKLQTNETKKQDKNTSPEVR